MLFSTGRRRWYLSLDERTSSTWSFSRGVSLAVLQRVDPARPAPPPACESRRSTEAYDRRVATAPPRRSSGMTRHAANPRRGGSRDSTARPCPAIAMDVSHMTGARMTGAAAQPYTMVSSVTLPWGSGIVGTASPRLKTMGELCEEVDSSEDNGYIIGALQSHNTATLTTPGKDFRRRENQKIWMPRRTHATSSDRLKSRRPIPMSSSQVSTAAEDIQRDEAVWEPQLNTPGIYVGSVGLMRNTDQQSPKAVNAANPEVCDVLPVVRLKTCSN